jgi:hypothetical protein
MKQFDLGFHDTSALLALSGHSDEFRAVVAQ